MNSAKMNSVKMNRVKINQPKITWNQKDLVPKWAGTKMIERETLKLKCTSFSRIDC